MKCLLVIALAACGGNSAALDAGPSDSPVDTFGPPGGDAPSGAVTIRVTRIGHPQGGLGVYFQQADSSLVKAVLTDDAGTAFAVLDAGGFVTVVDRRGQFSFDLSTFAAVTAGEALELELEPAGPKDLVAMSLQVPLDTGGGVAGYVVHTACSEPFGLDTSGGGTFGVFACGGATDFVVQSHDAEGALLRGFHAANVPLVGDVVTLSGTYTSPATTTFQYTNVPTGFAAIGAQHVLSASRRAFSETTFADRTSSTVLATVRTPPAGANPLFITTQHPNIDELDQHVISEWTAAPLAIYSLDLAASLLPRLDGAPAYDLVTRSIAWSESGGGVTANFVRARLGVHRTAIPEGRTWTWNIVAPHTGTRIAYPVLPVGEFDFNPNDTDSDTVTVRDLTAAKLPAGAFADFHARGFANLTTTITGPSGTLVQRTLKPDGL